MSQPAIRIRSFILGSVLVLLLLPPLAGAAAWFVERDHQQAGIQRRLDTAVAYLTAHRAEIRAPAARQGFAGLLERLDLLAQLSLATNSPPGKSQVYLSPALLQAQGGHEGRTRPPAQTLAAAPAVRGARWADDGVRLIPVGTSRPHETIAVDLFYRPPSRATRALVALVSGILVMLAGLAVVVWLAGRWMVAPLTRLSAQVDKVAGGDLSVAVPRSRIAEITNIALAVEGMTSALGETARRRSEADEARRFLVTSIAHDLRTPVFALRGHLQAIASGVGDPAVHLERAEARADALERLIGNLFAYTRDDYAQPALRLEAVPVADLVQEVAAGLEHTARLRDVSFELDGGQAIGVTVDRDRIKRSLTNILDNAIRYSPTGAPIQLGWRVLDDSSVEITIQDRGPGIDPGLLPHIFEPGIRASAPDGNRDGGAGLGLTIARRLLEQQRATLTVRNGPAGGAEVLLTVPRAPSRFRSRRGAGLRDRDAGWRPVGGDDLADEVFARDGTPDA